MLLVGWKFTSVAFRSAVAVRGPCSGHVVVPGLPQETSEKGGVVVRGVAFGASRETGGGSKSHPGFATRGLWVAHRLDHIDRAAGASFGESRPREGREWERRERGEVACSEFADSVSSPKPWG